MKNHIGMICIFLAFSVELNSSLQALKEGLLCVTDYCKSVSCSLKLPVTFTRNISHWLEFQWNNHTLDKYGVKHGPYRCPLQRARDDHTCTFTLNRTMTDFDIVDVMLHYLENDNKNLSQLNDRWTPAKNIKPKAPFILTLKYTNGMYNLSWINGYEDEHYGPNLPIVYTFLYYRDGDNGSEVSVPSYNKVIQIDEMTLNPVTTYTAMVRSGIQEEPKYAGTWSEWSNAVKWKTRAEYHGTSEDEPSKVGKIVIGTFLTFLFLLIFVPAARFKMKEILWVPTPATYFQPLYQNYQGNFQVRFQNQITEGASECWVLAKSPLQNFDIMEDFSTIDKISEVMMTTLQDEVEKMGMFPAAQCHQPYVGPTAEVWAPRQMPDTCSETSIPCEEFSLFCEDLPDKVDDIMQSLSVACLSGDVLSLKDSALSLESLEDCEESEAPVIINTMPMCFKQDYCTLTNTPTGPVPTFTI